MTVNPRKAASDFIGRLRGTIDAIVTLIIDHATSKLDRLEKI
jgi:hypothetical protein